MMTPMPFMLSGCRMAWRMLPLPVLDGGHLMYYLFEGLSGRAVSERLQLQLQRVGFLVLLLVMGLALSNDVARMVQH